MFGDREVVDVIVFLKFLTLFFVFCFYKMNDQTSFLY